LLAVAAAGSRLLVVDGNDGLVAFTVKYGGESAAAASTSRLSTAATVCSSIHKYTVKNV